MALIRCPDCGRDVSDRASACPNCGRPLNEARVLDTRAHSRGEGPVMKRKDTKRPIKREVNEEIAGRMIDLYADLGAAYFKKTQGEVLSYRKFALIVANLHPEGRLYDQSTVATWIKYGQRPDDADTQRAIAKAFGVLPGWVWYGAGSQYPNDGLQSHDRPTPTTEGVVIGRSFPKREE